MNNAVATNERILEKNFLDKKYNGIIVRHEIINETILWVSIYSIKPSNFRNVKNGDKNVDHPLFTKS